MENKKRTDLEECIVNYKGNYYLKTEVGYKKIILTTDQDLIADGVQKIDDEFLEWFCSKNGEIDFVKIITIENEKKYKIIIPSKELINPFELPNVLPDDVFNKSLEEAAERPPYFELVDKKVESNNTIDLDAYAKGVEDGVIWQAKRMFSEEDMIEFGKFCYIDAHSVNRVKTFKELLEQFKKK